MKLIVDTLSGDFAPYEIIKGAFTGAHKNGVELILIGDEETIKGSVSEYGLPNVPYTCVQCESRITMEDDPLSILKSNRGSSMAVGFDLLKEKKGDAFLSAGNTGAMLVGSSLILKRIKGIKSAAIGAVLPMQKPTLLIDSGANVEVSPVNLLQFALMGSIYMKNMYSIDSPEIGLLNNGEEATKGTPVYREAHALLKESQSIRFVGNVEGRSIPFGACDVLVADGFSGNIVLKLAEGFGGYLKDIFKSLFKGSIKGMIAYPLLKKDLYKLVSKMDHSKYGGAPILGVSAPVIKAHGSSKASSIEAAVAQAKTFASSNIVDEIALLAKSLKEESRVSEENKDEK